MTRYLALGFFLSSIAVTSADGAGHKLPEVAPHWVTAGLTLEGSDTAPDNATPDPSGSCTGVSFFRSLQYGDSDQNLLDVASLDSKDSLPRPVLLFVAGESFTADKGASDVTGALEDQAMCFAARNGMVGVKVNFRLAPQYPWPAGARDVAAATSWVSQNIDLFGGSGDEIVAVGYAAGAFHVASLLAHREFQVSDADIAGAVLVSGIYRLNGDASAPERAYFGADAGKYSERSAFPGILNLDIPIILSWSAADPPRLVTQGEKLKTQLCNSPTQCPRTIVLRDREGLAAVFKRDKSGDSLAEPILQLVREIEARGLP